MNVKIPNSMKSPTVIVIGQGTMDEKKNSIHEKRMDNLERKLDQQYKSVVNNSGFEKKLDQLQKSFENGMNKVVSANKKLINNDQSKRIESLKRELEAKINSVRKLDSGKENLKPLVRKLDSLETALSKIPSKIQVSQPKSQNLNASFEKMISRLESAIDKVKPRMYPSPS